jgi:predicted chitinase
MEISVLMILTGRDNTDVRSRKYTCTYANVRARILMILTGRDNTSVIVIALINNIVVSCNIGRTKSL